MGVFVKQANGRISYTDHRGELFDFSGNEDLRADGTNPNVIIIEDDSRAYSIDQTRIITPASTDRDNLLELLSADFFTGAPIAKSNQVIVTDPSQLAGILDSAKQYFIDGVIDMGNQSIQVPAGGLSLQGYGFDLSALISSQANFSLFTSPIGGSGNLLLTDLAVETSGLNAKLYNLTDSNGTHAVEHNRVNFNNCTSLGELKDYRQGLELNTGRFGGTPTLTFSGAQNGYRVTTSIVRGISNIDALFKAGTGLTFSGRFITDINADLPAVGALIDFSPANFVNDESLILKGAFITRQGVINSADIALYPNINASSVKSNWADNTGFPNTTKYIKTNISSEVLTPIASQNVYVPLLGTRTIEKLSHFDMPVNGQYRLLSGNGTYQFTGDFIISGNANDQIDLRVTKSINGGATFPIEINHIKRTINNLSGNRDVAFMPINFLDTLNKNDRVRIEVENKTAGRAVTAEIDSFLIVSQV